MRFALGHIASYSILSSSSPAKKMLQTILPVAITLVQWLMSVIAAHCIVPFVSFFIHTFSCSTVLSSAWGTSHLLCIHNDYGAKPDTHAGTCREIWSALACSAHTYSSCWEILTVCSGQGDCWLVLGSSEKTGWQLHRFARIFSVQCSWWWHWFWLGFSTPWATFSRLWKEIKTWLHYLSFSPGNSAAPIYCPFICFGGHSFRHFFQSMHMQ